MSVGYPDFERSVAWDGAVLLNAAGIPFSNVAGIVEGPYDVSHWAVIQGHLGVTGVDSQLIFSWYIDKAMTGLVAQREMRCGNSIPTVNYMNLLNRGPWLTVAANTLVVGAAQLHGYLQGSNRVHAIDQAPLDEVLFAAPGGSYGGGTSSPYYPYSAYAGPVNVYTNAAAAAFTVALQYLDNSDNWTTIDEWAPPAGPYSRITLTPLSAWRLVLKNTGGPTEGCDFCATASATGSV